MFKKIISLVLCFAIILSALPITGIAATMEDFVIDENGVLVKYNGAGGDVIIPDRVVAIGDSVFFQQNSITSVILPESVISIGDSAFSNCTELEKVYLPDNLILIGGHFLNVLQRFIAMLILIVFFI